VFSCLFFNSLSKKKPLSANKRPNTGKCFSIYFPIYFLKKKLLSANKQNLVPNSLDCYLCDTGVKQESTSPAGLKPEPFGFGFVLKRPQQ